LQVSLKWLTDFLTTQPCSSPALLTQTYLQVLLAKAAHSIKARRATRHLLLTLISSSSASNGTAAPPTAFTQTPQGIVAPILGEQGEAGAPPASDSESTLSSAQALERLVDKRAGAAVEFLRAFVCSADLVTLAPGNWICSATAFSAHI
jgi:hypothetical protein